MSAWWGREAWGPLPKDATVRGTPSAPTRPRPLPVGREAAARAVAGRIRSFTPEWTNQGPADPGTALVRVFSEEMEAVLARADRLPEKALVEFLRDAGIESLPATPAAAALAFTLSGATESVLVPVGFQVGAPPATGQGDLVIFETTRDLFAAPATLEELHVQEGTAIRRVPVPSGGDAPPLEPFGRRAEAGRSLYLGLATENPDARLLNRLTLGVAVFAPPAPPPVPAGGVAPLPVPPPPLLRWQLLDGASWTPLEVALDQTGGLVRSGVIELELPRTWRPGVLKLGGTRLRWLRLSILYGRYPDAPSLRAIQLNVVPAVAARTVRDEVLEPVPDGRNRQFRVSQTPVLPDSLVVEVDEGAAPAPLLPEGEDPAAPATVRRWTSVASLADAGSEDRVYVLDPASGVLQFGEGVHGAAVPDGFRNLRAVVYQVGGGAAGAVLAETITTQLSSAPFVTGVTNPLPASGGMDAEPFAATRRRGPQEIRARNRAVAVADYALLAQRAPGAQVVRAHAVSGHHPAHPGVPIPGVVGVYVVPPDRNEGPPTPDQESLGAVARYLAENAAPAGVEVVAGAPFYHKVRAEIGVVIDPAADQGETVRRLGAALDGYLHPIGGGEDGEGWPFGGTLRYAPLLRRLVTGVPGVRAIKRLTLVIDGARVPACIDFQPRPHALFWPTPHEVVPVETERTP